MTKEHQISAPLPGGSTFGVPVAQLALVIPDVDAAVEAYWSLLGIGPWKVYVVGGPKLRDVTYRGQPARFKIRYALATSGALTLELIQPLEGPSIWQEYLDRGGATLHHFAFYVPDFEEAARHMAGRGWVAVQTGDGFGRTGDGRFAYYEHGDDIGCLVEIVQAPTERDIPVRVHPPPSAG